MPVYYYYELIPGAKDRHDKELHHAKVAVNAIVLSTSKVMRLPLVQLKFVSLAASLVGTCNLLGSR